LRRKAKIRKNAEGAEGERREGRREEIRSGFGRENGFFSDPISPLCVPLSDFSGTSAFDPSVFDPKNAEGAEGERREGRREEARNGFGMENGFFSDPISPLCVPLSAFSGTSAFAFSGNQG